MTDSPIALLAECYPQLKLPLGAEMKLSPLYRSVVLRGEAYDGDGGFRTSEKDSLTVFSTPYGDVRILYLEHREDFEHALRALAYGCEPREILPSVGANIISGLANWEKIRAHQREYLLGGGTDWHGEFRRFTSDKANYRDTLILLSSGYYSGISPEQMGLTPEKWREKSLVIRMYHELTHFLCGKLLKSRPDVVQEEILADCIGLRRAFGSYDPGYARLFLGIENGSCRRGGRLRHYIEEENLPGAVRDADELIGRLAGML